MAPRRFICEAINCRAPAAPLRVFCPEHLAMVDPETRHRLGRTFRPRHWRQSALFLDYLARARQEVAHVVTYGRPAPRDQPLDFHDPKA
jgi:hypothetical protein